MSIFYICQKYANKKTLGLLGKCNIFTNPGVRKRTIDCPETDI